MTFRALQWYITLSDWLWPNELKQKDRPYLEISVVNDTSYTVIIGLEIHLFSLAWVLVTQIDAIH